VAGACVGGTWVGGTTVGAAVGGTAVAVGSGAPPQPITNKTINKQGIINPKRKYRVFITSSKGFEK
jgi:hypothetical protein